jgi:hypothetical protein
MLINAAMFSNPGMEAVIETIATVTVNLADSDLKMRNPTVLRISVLLGKHHETFLLKDV